MSYKAQNKNRLSLRAQKYHIELFKSTPKYVPEKRERQKPITPILPKVVNRTPHEKPDWHLKWTDKWRNPKAVDLYGFGGYVEPNPDFLTDKALENRRKHVFRFFREFFDNYDQSRSVFTFSDDEKAELLEKYFKKYFHASRKIEADIVDPKVESLF